MRLLYPRIWHALQVGAPRGMGVVTRIQAKQGDAWQPPPRGHYVEILQRPAAAAAEEEAWGKATGEAHSGA